MGAADGGEAAGQEDEGEEGSEGEEDEEGIESEDEEGIESEEDEEGEEAAAKRGSRWSLSAARCRPASMWSPPTRHCWRITGPSLPSLPKRTVLV